jgi:hypothetical protein
MFIYLSIPSLTFNLYRNVYSAVILALNAGGQNTPSRYAVNLHRAQWNELPLLWRTDERWHSRDIWGSRGENGDLSWVETPRGLVCRYDVSEKHTVSILRVEVGVGFQRLQITLGYVIQGLSVLLFL